MIDIETLCLPISEQSPTGVDLRQDASANSLYYEIKDARYQARDMERKLQLGGTDFNPKPHWDKVFSMSCDLLENHSKDMEAAIWLLEALVRRDKINGLKQGFHLLFALLDRFWEQLYPKIAEDDYEVRLAPLIGLNGVEREGTLIYPIQWLPITPLAGGEQYVFWQYKKCLQDDKITDVNLRKKRREESDISLDAIHQAVKAAPADFYSHLSQDIDESIHCYQKIISWLDDKCGDASPPSSDIIEALLDFRQHIEFVTQESGMPIGQHEQSDNIIPSEEAPCSQHSAEEIVTKTETLSPHFTAQRVDDREQALRMLQQIADFFQREEPHSPLSALIERAVKWGQLPLSELLNEMIADQQARRQVCNLIGIEQNET